MEKRPTDSSDDSELRMTFTEHLGELRIRLIRSVLALGVGFLVCFFLFNYIFEIVSRPLRPLQVSNIFVSEKAPEDSQETSEGAAPKQTTTSKTQSPVWTVLNPLEPFVVNMKLAAYFGLLLALPYIIYQACAFVFPGLKPNEKRAVLILLFGCSALAIFGVAVAYFGVFPLVLPYLMQYAPEGVQVQLRMNETVTMVMIGLVGFAIAFQFPMVVLILVYLDLLTPDQLRSWRRFAIVGLSFLAAVLTPPDPFSMLLMAGPLVLLYEISIWGSYAVVRYRDRRRPV